MPRFAANLSMMYPDLPFLDRFEAAAKDGFKAVEYLFPYAFAVPELVSRLQANGLQQVLFNTPPGGADLRAALTDGEDYELVFALAAHTDAAAFARAWHRRFPRTRA